MAIKKYRHVYLDIKRELIVIDSAEPHVCIRLKEIFPKIPKTKTVPFNITYTDQDCHDILWFMQRYPLEISDQDLKLMQRCSGDYVTMINEVEAILRPDYKPDRIFVLKDGAEKRNYQISGAEVMYKMKRILCADDTGLGKTLTSLLLALMPGTLPAVVVVETHMVHQWQYENVEKFTNLRVHAIKGTKPYSLPEADIYIIKYSCLAGWCDVFTKKMGLRHAVFDECQQLRRSTSQKYAAAKKLSESVEYCVGLSATPIYNYGDEIYTVLNCIKPQCLGGFDAFAREWMGGGSFKVKDPKALGAFLKESLLMLRRTRKEVGKDLPPVNRIIHTIGYDYAELKKSEDLAKELAMKIFDSTSFIERGQSAREFDLLLRQATGIAKAREVAAYVRILLENGERVLLSGWHREVYRIWLEELKDLTPLMYTGSETEKQKLDAKFGFINGKSNLLIISNRSGAGLDGLQKVCNLYVCGELDYSPKVHNQLIDRIDRPGQTFEDPVTAIFLVTEDGSDPGMIEILGLKSSQSAGIMDPFETVPEQMRDESRIKALANHYLNSKKKQHSDPE